MNDFHVDVDPNVVFQLGDTLISDEVTALVELVKNSYDADASYAQVSVVTGDANGADDTFYPTAEGHVTVEDDGTGMDLEQIRQGWLVVAASEKREAKARGEVTPLHGRSLLGDKGLGRLGVQRLGSTVEIFTRKSKVADTSPPTATPVGKAHHVGIDWRDFQGRKSIRDVPVRVELTTKIQRGTRILISGLRRPDYWSQAHHRLDLQKKLSQFVSPFRTTRDFRVFASIDGDRIDLIELSSANRRAALAQHSFACRNGVLKLTSKYRVAALKPTERASREFEETVGTDIEGLRAHLIGTQKVLKNAASDDRWFLKIVREIALDRLADVSRSQGSPVDPGPFDGEIDVYSLRGPVLSAELNEMVAAQRGIRIYRDGFAIRPYGIDGEDWLRLGQSQTGGASFYGLRPGNVIGYVAISAGENPQLVEKTDREGFVESPASANFLRLMSEARDAINIVNQAVRRGFNEYRRAAHLSPEHTTSKMSSSSLLNEIAHAPRQGSAIRKSAEQLRSAVAAVQDVVDELGPSGSTVRRELTALDAASSRLDALLVEHADRLDKWAPAAISAELGGQELRQRLDDLTSLAALGLAAEAISHEAQNIANTLVDRTTRLRKHLRRVAPADSDVETHVESVRSSLSALRKQISHLGPALRYVREQRTRFSLRDFVSEIVEFHDEGLRGRGIKIEARGIPDLILHMNRGRLVQVVDNLILNSRYWLRQDIAAGRVKDAAIEISGGSAYLDVSDNGRGVDPNIEEIIFEPFITNKPPGQGRGLGLFIARQLIEGSGGSLELLSDRNREGNRHTFRIGLEGTIDA